MTELTDGRDRPIVEVRAGMRVEDADGQTIGTVIHVSTGDEPEPGDARARRPDDGRAESLLGDEPAGCAGAADRLMSGGYLKVLGTGVRGVDCYVAADQILQVDDLAVLLKVGQDQLVAQQ